MNFNLELIIRPLIHTQKKTYLKRVSIHREGYPGYEGYPECYPKVSRIFDKLFIRERDINVSVYSILLHNPDISNRYWRCIMLYVV